MEVTPWPGEIAHLTVLGMDMDTGTAQSLKLGPAHHPGATEAEGRDKQPIPAAGSKQCENIRRLSPALGNCSLEPITRR